MEEFRSWVAITIGKEASAVVRWTLQIPRPPHAFRWRSIWCRKIDPFQTL